MRLSGPALAELGVKSRTSEVKFDGKPRLWIARHSRLPTFELMRTSQMSTSTRKMLQDELPGMPDDAAFHDQDQKQKLFDHLNRRKARALEVAVPALNGAPHDPEILLMAVIAALLDARPDAALRYLHRFTKRFVPHGYEDQLLKAVALAQQGIWRPAWNIVDRNGRFGLRSAAICLPVGAGLHSWFGDWLQRIEDEERRRRVAEKRAEKADAKRRTSTAAVAAAGPDPQASVAGIREDPATAEGLSALPRHNIAIPLAIELPEALENDLTVDMGANDMDAGDVEMFRLRYEFTELGLLQGFDELLCLPALRGVEIHWYQVEAARRALKQFRGRVLLADEVGLGKTIEAGLVIAQLLAEGARRILLIAPKPLLGQWKQELFQLFDLVTREADARAGSLDGDGVFLIGREQAGSERGLSS